VNIDNNQPEESSVNEVREADVKVEDAASPETGELQQLKTDRDELRDLLLRRQAEFDNFRKRTERERSEQSQYASMEAVRELIPILDDFERALKAECKSSDYARGVELIYNRMLEALKKTGLEPMESIGKPFDPHQHQAIERVETKDAEDNTVIGEFQRGYSFKGRLLRPAMVKVAVHG
jgi:molecular chaperone GrpE